MTRVPFLLLAAAGTGLISAQAPDPTGHYQPFTAEIKSTYYDEEGRRSEFADWFSRKADGSYSREGETEACGRRGRYRQIFHALGSFVADVHYYTQSAYVIPLVTEARFRQVRDAYANCERFETGWRLLGESQYLGIRVVGFEYTSGRRVTREWVAPELACFPFVEHDVDGGELRSLRRVVSVDLEEPEPARFQIPPEIRLVTPVEDLRLLEKFCGRPLHEGQRLHAESAEREYQQAKPHWRGPFRLP